MSKKGRVCSEFIKLYLIRQIRLLFFRGFAFVIFSSASAILIFLRSSGRERGMGSEFFATSISFLLLSKIFTRQEAFYIVCIKESCRLEIFEYYIPKRIHETQKSSNKNLVGKPYKENVGGIFCQYYKRIMKVDLY